MTVYDKQTHSYTYSYTWNKSGARQMCFKRIITSLIEPSGNSALRLLEIEPSGQELDSLKVTAPAFQTHSDTYSYTYSYTSKNACQTDLISIMPIKSFVFAYTYRFSYTYNNACETGLTVLLSQSAHT